MKLLFDTVHGLHFYEGGSVARKNNSGSLVWYPLTWFVKDGKVHYSRSDYYNETVRYDFTVQRAYKTWRDSTVLDIILNDSLELPAYVAR